MKPDSTHEAYKAEVRRTHALLKPISTEAAAIFYPILFEVDPSAKVCEYTCHVCAHACVESNRSSTCCNAGVLLGVSVMSQQVKVAAVLDQACASTVQKQ